MTRWLTLRLRRSRRHLLRTFPTWRCWRGFTPGPVTTRALPTIWDCWMTAASSSRRSRHWRTPFWRVKCRIYSIPSCQCELRVPDTIVDRVDSFKTALAAVTMTQLPRVSGTRSGTRLSLTPASGPIVSILQSSAACFELSKNKVSFSAQQRSQPRLYMEWPSGRIWGERPLQLPAGPLLWGGSQQGQFWGQMWLCRDWAVGGAGDMASLCADSQVRSAYEKTSDRWILTSPSPNPSPSRPNQSPKTKGPIGTGADI